MHDPEKSDSAVVTVEPPNKAGSPAAEAAEPRAGTKGNADQQSTHRTQTRERVTQALNRVRQAARQRKKERFTALLHQRRHALDGVLCAQTQSRRRCRRRHMAGLRGGPRAESRGPPWKGPPGSISATTISPDVHTEGGWSAEAASDRSSGKSRGPDRRPGLIRFLSNRLILLAERRHNSYWGTWPFALTASVARSSFPDPPTWIDEAGLNHLPQNDRNASTEQGAGDPGDRIESILRGLVVAFEFSI
jgi:hypothetical protein